MKKILRIFSALAVMVIAGTTSVKAENYVINDNAVEAVFASCDVASGTLDYANSILPHIPNEKAKLTGNANGWVAFALCTFLGPLGIHRFYMGTDPFTGFAYILTCGGCFGVIPTIDWFVLLIANAVNNDISKYEDNSKFMMW